MWYYDWVSVLIFGFVSAWNFSLAAYPASLIHDDTVEVLPFRETIEVIDDLLITIFLHLAILLYVIYSIWLRAFSWEIYTIKFTS